MANITHTGITRTLDSFGRITLPMQIRKQLGIGENDTVEFCTCEDGVVLVKYSAENKAENSMKKKLVTAIEQALDEGFSKHIPLTSDYLAEKLLPMFETEKTPAPCIHEWERVAESTVGSVYVCKRCGNTKTVWNF